MRGARPRRHRRVRRRRPRRLGEHPRQLRDRRRGPGHDRRRRARRDRPRDRRRRSLPPGHDRALPRHRLRTRSAPATPSSSTPAAGGVGLLLSQIASGAGRPRARHDRRPPRRRTPLAREAGAARGAALPGDDLADRVRDLTDGEGVAVRLRRRRRVTFDASLASLRRRGMLVLYGAASGPVPPVDPQRLNRAGSLYLTRPKLHGYTAPAPSSPPARRRCSPRSPPAPLARPHRPPLPAGRRRAGPPRPRGPPDDRQGASLLASR